MSDRRSDHVPSSELVLRETVGARWAARSVFTRAREGCAVAGRAVERVRREQSGQDVIEYAGMIVLVAVIILALIRLGIPGTVSHAVHEAIDSIFSSGGSGGSGSSGNLTSTAGG